MNSKGGLGQNRKKGMKANSFPRHQAKTVKPDTRQSLFDYLGSATQASDFETTTEFIINYIKKTFGYGNDIGTSLKELTISDSEKWEAKMRVSTASDSAVYQLETRQFEMEYKSDYEESKSRAKTYEQNVIKAYALIWERYTKGMKNKIKARMEFATKIENDPIELLKAIKEHSQNFQEHRYNMSIILDSMRGLLNVKQKEGETLQDWTKRFGTAREVLESHFGGPIIIPKIVENMPEHDPNNLEMIKKCQMKPFEGFRAFHYLENADKLRYGSILTGLNTQQSLGNDPYPKTICEANNVLSNHKLETPLKSRKEQDFNKPKRSMQKERDNSNEQEITLSFAQMEGKCYCCGKAGHRSTSCRHKDRPKAEWAINKAQPSFAQPQVEQSSTSVGTAQQSPNDQQPSESRVSTGWAGAHIPFGFAQVDIMRTWILLDNQSSATIFCNPIMVKNIRKTNDCLDLQTNAGILSKNMKCDIPEWGEAWFNPNAITNIFSYAEMAKKHCITTDPAEDNAFIVHLPDKQIRFESTANGLYAYVPNLKKNIKWKFKCFLLLMKTRCSLQLHNLKEHKGFETYIMH